MTWGVFGSLCVMWVAALVATALQCESDWRLVLEYIGKWLGILAPVWLLLLVALYAVVAGEYTTSGFDPVHFGTFFDLGASP